MDSRHKNYNSRGDFIQKASLAFVSILGLKIMSFKSTRTKKRDPGYPVISSTEANDLIRNMKNENRIRLRPSPPPSTENRNALENLKG